MYISMIQKLCLAGTSGRLSVGGTFQGEVLVAMLYYLAVVFPRGTGSDLLSNIWRGDAFLQSLWARFIAQVRLMDGARPSHG